MKPMIFKCDWCREKIDLKDAMIDLNYIDDNSISWHICNTCFNTKKGDE